MKQFASFDKNVIDLLNNINEPLNQKLKIIGLN